MSVEETEVIDGVGIQRGGPAVVLLISDHLPWNSGHISILQSKLEAYVKAAVSGKLVESYPEAKGRPVSIRLVWQHEPTPDARVFIDKARDQIAAAGIAMSDGPLLSS